MASSQLPQDLTKLGGALLASAIDATVTPLVLVDNRLPQQPIIYANAAFLAMSGYSLAETIGQNCRMLQGPQTSQLAVRQLRQAIVDGQTSRVTIKNYRKDGTEFWNDVSLAPLRNKAGRVTHYLGMQDDISHRVDQARVMEMAQRQLLLSLKSAKDEFVALSSHQLRTPATGVKQYLSMVLDGYAGKVPTGIEPYLQTAYESNERQLDIIDSLLQAARLDGNDRHIVKRPESVNVLVSEVVSDYASILNMRRQTVALILADHSTAPIDSTELRLVFANLLENASRYSAEGEVITVRVRQTAKAITVSFKDNGVGIAPADHRRIFDKFTRVDNPLSDTVSGNGLGLYFVKRIIRMHGAKLRVRSSIGKGSTFSVILPI